MANIKLDGPQESVEMERIRSDGIEGAKTDTSRDDEVLARMGKKPVLKVR